MLFPEIFFPPGRGGGIVLAPISQAQDPPTRLNDPVVVVRAKRFLGKGSNLEKE